MTEAEQTARRRVCEIAVSWLGTPYHHRARIKGAGVDCGQLIAAVFREAGLIDEVPLEEYPADWMMHRSEERFRETVERYARPVDRSALPGDIMLFKWGRCISHGAIVLEYPRLVHAFVRQGVVYGDAENDSRLVKRKSGFWTLKNGWT